MANPIKKAWQDGFWGKVGVSVMAFIIISIISGAVAIPITYQTKKESKYQTEKLDERTCKKIDNLKKDVEKNEERFELILEKISEMNNSLGRIEGGLKK